MVEIGQVGFKGEKNVFRARVGGARKTKNSPFPFNENSSAQTSEGRAKRGLSANEGARANASATELMQCGGGGNSFSPLTPFPCRRRSWHESVIFAKICSSSFVDLL